MTTLSQDKKINTTAFPLVLAEINSVASLSSAQLSNISNSLNMPMDELNEIFEEAQEQSVLYKSSNPLANISRERLATHIEYCQLGFIDDWDDPVQLDLNEHPLVVSMGGKIYHTIVYSGNERNNEVALGCPIATDLRVNDYKLKTLPEFSEIVLSKINESDFDGFGEFKVGKLHIAIMFVDFNRFVGAVPDHENLFGENKVQGSLNFVFEILEFLSPSSTQDELQDIFSVLVNTAILVDWCNEDSIEKVATYSQGLKSQLSHLICMIVGKPGPIENSEPLFLIDIGNDMAKLLSITELEKYEVVGTIFKNRLKAAELFEWTRFNVGISSLTALRVR